MKGKEERKAEESWKEEKETEPIQQMKKGIRVHETTLSSTDSLETKTILLINIARIYLEIALMTPNEKEKRNFREKILRYLQDAEEALDEIEDKLENEEIRGKVERGVNQIRLELEKCWTG